MYPLIATAKTTLPITTWILPEDNQSTLEKTTRIALFALMILTGLFLLTLVADGISNLVHRVEPIQEAAFASPLAAPLAPPPRQTSEPDSRPLSLESTGEIVAAPRTSPTMGDNVRAFFLDPGNPKKGLKYHYALHALWRRLRQLGGNPFAPVDELRLDKPDLGINGYCALSALENPERYASVREQNAHFLFHLRAALLAPAQRGLESGRKLLEELCYVKYTGVYMYEFVRSFLRRALEGKIPTTLTSQTIAAAIRTANTQLRNVDPEFRKQGVAREFEKLKGTLGFNFDPTAAANPPWVHSLQTIQTEEGRKEIKILRQGTPTTDPSLLGMVLREVRNILRWVWTEAPQEMGKDAEVIPEYRAFLRAAEEKNERVLYVNHQEGDSDHGEGNRSDVIRDLETEHKNFHYAALPMRDDVWKRSKSDVIDSLQNRTNGFFLPRCLRRVDLPLGELWDKVERLYFKGKVPEDPKAKRVFFMLFYSELKDFLKGHLKISFFNASCKDDKDRGNASKLCDMFKIALLLGKEDDPEQLKALFWAALAPFIIKNEQIIPERLELALEVIEHLSQLTPEEKQAIRENPTCRYLDQSVPKEADPWTAAVHSTKEFVALVRQMEKENEEHVIRRPNFSKDVRAAYKTPENEWNLLKLRAQIERDLKGMSIKLGLREVSSFEELLAALGLKESLFTNPNFDQSTLTEEEQKSLCILAILHQGMAAPGYEAIDTHFRPNPCGAFIQNRPQGSGGRDRQTFLTLRLSDTGKPVIECVAYLQIAFPEGSEPIPLICKTVVTAKQAEIRWRFGDSLLEEEQRS